MPPVSDTVAQARARPPAALYPGWSGESAWGAGGSATTGGDPSTSGQSADHDYQRHVIHKAHGADARIRVLSDAQDFGAPVFVVDIDKGPEHYRILGAFGPVRPSAPDPEARLVMLSGMDLIYPARLVFHCEQLMSLAFALCDSPASALLLGVGGAGMWRFVRAHLPECVMTLVDNDNGIVDIARRWFYLDQNVLIEPGQNFLAHAKQRFDVILVDQYDSRGSTLLGTDFWEGCVAALNQGGCLATNWPDFTDNGNPREIRMAETQREVARLHGHDCFFIGRSDWRGNVVQYLPTAPGRDHRAVRHELERFATKRGLPDGGGTILEDCVISPSPPVLT